MVKYIFNNFFLTIELPPTFWISDVKKPSSNRAVIDPSPRVCLHSANDSNNKITRDIFQ